MHHYLNNYKLLFFIFLSCFLKAQEATEPSELLSKNDFKIENNSVYNFYKSEESKTHSFTPLAITLRYAVLDKLELIGTINYTAEKENLSDETDKRNGLEPISIGVKTPILQENGLIPEMALVGSATLSNLAAPDYKNDHVQWNLLAVFSNSINDKLSLSYNIGLTFEEDINPDWFYTAALDYSYTEKSKIYTEINGSMPKESTEDIYGSIGWQHIFADKFEFDITTGTGIKSDLKWFVSTGFTWLIHTKKTKAAQN